MAESTLTLTVDDIRNSITEEMYGGDGLYSSLSSAEKIIVDRTRASGMRQFYSPPPVGGKAHEWSFMFPVATLSINAPQSSSTITYDHTGGSSENLVTLASGTWPTWAADAMIRISGTDYPVATRVDATKLTLDSSDNPGADVAALTEYSLHQDDYTLPDNFGRIMGAFTFAQGDNAWYTAQIVGEARIREMRMRGFNNASSQGDPRFAAIRPKIRNDNYTTGAVVYDHTGGASERLLTLSGSGAAYPSWAGSAKVRIGSTTYDVDSRLSDTTLTLSSSSNPGTDVGSSSYTMIHASGGRQEVLFWPNISASATVTYRYRILPDDIGDTNPYPYGATDHSETILYSCLAEAERRIDNERGVMFQRFVECLAASIARDARDNSPEVFGYNGDESDGRAMFGSHRDFLYGTGISHKGTGGS